MNQQTSPKNKPESPAPDQSGSLVETYRKLEPYLGLGLTFTVTILAFLFLGRWLDEKLGTSPWLIITGAFLGMVLGFIHLYYTVTQIDTNGKGQESE